jgi:hypothetical protein
MKPPEPIVRAAELEGDFRWTLSRRWADGPLMACVGCNPSHADHKRDDPTMWRVMGFAFRWGFAGVVMLNVYPFVTPHISTLRTWRFGPAPAVDFARVENVRRVAGVLRVTEFAVAAWGNLPLLPDVISFDRDLAEVNGSPVTWRCLGTTNDGAPKHPMARGKHRVPDDAKPQPWRLAS